MALLSRGFRPGRQARTDGRLPPGQYDVGDGFPVLSAGPTPRTPLSSWDLSIDDATGRLDRAARRPYACCTRRGRRPTYSVATSSAPRRRSP